MVRRYLVTGFSTATKSLTSRPSVTTMRTADYGTRSLAVLTSHRSTSTTRTSDVQRYYHHETTPVGSVLVGAQRFASSAKRRGGRKSNNDNIKKKSNKLKPVANLAHTLTPSVGQTRAERIKELRKIAKEKILEYEDLYRKKSKGDKLPDPPPDAAHHLLQYLDASIPNDIKDSKDAIIDYILNVFLVAFPAGARLRKLQRDIAFRMDTKDLYLKNKKLQYEKILPIIGEMERAGQLKIRLGKQGRLIMYKPSESQLAVDVLNTKIDQVMHKHFGNTASSEVVDKEDDDDVDDDDDDVEDENENDDDDYMDDDAKDVDDSNDDTDSDNEEKLELNKKDYLRRYGLEENQTDWIEEERRRSKPS
jgi:hypothetical protein